MRESAEVARVEEELTTRCRQVPTSEAIAECMGKDVMWVEQRRAECWQVVVLRHGFEGEPMSFEAVGEEMGMSASSVRRIEQRALDRLRRHLQQAGAA